MPVHPRCFHILPCRFTAHRAEAVGGRLLGIGRCLTALSPPQNGACDFHRTPLKHLKGRVKDPSAVLQPAGCTIRNSSRCPYGEGAPVQRSHRHVQHLLCRFLRCSRAETPEGSQPTFVGDEIIPLCSITEQPSLAPSSCTRHPISFPYGALTLPGGRRAYHVSSVSLHGVGRASPPGIRHLRPVTLEHRFLIPSLLGHAYQHLPLV